MIFERLKEDFKKLQGTKEFKSFKKENPKAYFSSAFLMIESLDVKDIKWQIDYYDSELQKASTFIVNGDVVESKIGEEILQKKKEDIDELKLEDVKIGFDKAVEVIHKFRKKKYPEEKAQKIIIVLQNLGKSLVWNITYITVNLNLINFKINAVNGKVIESRMEPLIRFSSKILPGKKN